MPTPFSSSCMSIWRTTRRPCSTTTAPGPGGSICNEASDRDIEEFARRFDCIVWEGFGSTENAVIITREAGTLRGAVSRRAREHQGASW